MKIDFGSKPFESKPDKMNGPYLHLKSNRIYEVVSTEVLDATNGQEGKLMVAYISPGSYQMFVRDYDEFFDGRFKKVEEDNQCNNK